MLLHTDRNLLVGILALQMDFISQDHLIAAMQAWLSKKSEPLESVLEARGALDATTAQLLTSLVQKHLELHEDDVEQSLAALKSFDAPSEVLKSLDDPGLSNTLSLISTSLGDKAPTPSILQQQGTDQVSREVEECCNRFQEALENEKGDSVRIESILSERPEEERNGLFERLLSIELSFRWESGDEPTVEEYHERFPNRISVINQLFNVYSPILSTLPVEAMDEQPAPCRYRTIKLHAKGGLGEVYIATDQELHRKVALKEIQAKYADRAESRLRFSKEAEITGSLEHPGVVPVYGMGRHPDGRLYYAMRLIRGESMQDAIRSYHKSVRDGELSSKEQTLELRRLLARFIDVCDAMQYAHSRGVLHRDLKPANIMLGKYGETLVVDWGLARTGVFKSSKNQDESIEAPVLTGTASASQTQVGTVIGTPAFMSPEQAWGKLDELGPQSDVYSLGATLYAVLTGKPSVASGESAVSALDIVRKGTFPKPREIANSIPFALEQICLRAMELNPKDRYNSAQSLAKDIERWLADEAPVACPDTLWQRLGRWTRQHSAIVRASLAALLFIAMIACVAAVIINRERGIAVKLAEENSSLATAEAEAREKIESSLEEVRKLASRNLELAKLEEKAKQQAESRLEEVQKLAMANRDLAGRESTARLLAENRFKDVRQLANKFMFEIEESIRNLNGATPARRLLVQTALNYLGKLSRDANDDVDLRKEIAIAYKKIGDILGNNQVANLGETAASVKSYQVGLRHWSQATANEADNPEKFDTLCQFHDRLGIMMMMQGKLSIARGHLEKAKAAAETYVQLSDDKQDARAQLWIITNRIGDFQIKVGKQAEGRKLHQEGLQLIQRLVQDAPKSARLLRLLSVSHALVASDLERDGDDEAALPHHRERLRITQALLAASPTSARAIRDVAESAGSYATTLADVGKHDEAVEKGGIGLNLYEKMHKADPKNVQAVRDLAKANERMGDVYKEHNDHKKSLEWYKKARTILLPHSTGVGSSVFMQRTLGILDNKIGETYEYLGQPGVALRYYKASLAVDEAHYAKDPSNRAALRSISIGHQNIGIVAEIDHRYELAKQHYLKCAEIRESLHVGNKSAIALQNDLAYIDKRIAWLLATCPEENVRDAEMALKHAKRAVELTKNEDAIALSRLAAAYAESGDFVKAVEIQNQSIKLTKNKGTKETRQGILQEYQHKKPHRLTRTDTLSAWLERVIDFESWPTIPLLDWSIE